MKAKLSFSLPTISIENGNTGVTPINGTIYFSNFIRGPKGDPFRFEDFTQEQLDSLKGETGKGSTTMDLDNSNQSAPCNEDGSILEGFLENGNITTRAVIYDESTNVSYKWLFSIPTSSKYMCEVLQAYPNSNYAIIKVKSITTSDNSIDIPIQATLGDLTITKYLTVTKVKGGKNALIYSLQPSHNIIKRDKLNMVDPLKISCIELKRVGNEPPLPVNINKILYRIDNKGDFLNYPDGGVNTSNIYKYIDFRLVDPNQIVLDLERVPIVVDGTDGVNGIGSYIMDLSNEIDAVPCENDGTILVGAELPSTLVSVYYADTDDSSSWTFSVPPSEDYTVSTTMVGYSMKVQVLTILKDEVRIVINAIKGGTVLSKIFTVTKVRGGADALIFSLEPSVNVIKKDKGGILFPDTIACYAKKKRGIGEISFIVPEDNKKILYIMNNDTIVRPYIDSIKVTEDDKMIDFFLVNASDYTTGVLPSKIFDKERVLIIEDGKDGDSVYSIDLSNETESIPIEDNGSVLSGVTLPTTLLSIFKGFIQDTINWEVDIPISEDYTTSVTRSPNNDVLIKVLTLPSKREQVIIPIYATRGNITLMKEFTITKVKGGKNAIIYSLEPSVNVITKDSNNVITPMLISCKANKQIGSGIKEVTTDKKIIYRKGEMDNLHTYISPIAIAQSDKYIEFYLVEPNASIEVLPSIIFDKEKVPVVADGKPGLDGIGALILDLDNSNQSISCDKNGDPIENHPKIKTNTRIVNGDNNISKDFTFSTSIEASLYCVIVQPTEINNYASIEVDPNNVHFPINNVSVAIPIYAEKGGTTITKYLNISKVLNGESSILYEVRPSSNSIKLSSDNTFMPDKVSCTKWKIVGLEDPVEMGVDEGILKYRFLLSLDDGTISYTPYTTYTTPIVLNYEDHKNAIELEFTIFKDNSTVNPIILDYEGLPIITDGRPGPEGKASSYLDLSNEVQSVFANNDGVVVDSKTIIESEFRVFDGDLNNSDGWTYSYDNSSITPSVYITITQYAIGSVGAKYGKITVDVANMYANIDTVNIPIIATYARDPSRTLTKVLTITKVKGGKDIFIYSVVPSVSSIHINKLNEYSPVSINCSVYKKSSNGILEKLTIESGKVGNLNINFVTPGGTNKYNGDNLYTNTLSGYIEFILTNESGDVVDKERVPYITDGVDNYSLVATDSSIVVKTEPSGNIIGGSVVTKALVYKGGKDVTVDESWQLSIVSNPQVGYSIQNNLSQPSTYGNITITTVVPTNTTLIVRATKSGYPTLEYGITIAKVKDGSSGDNAIMYDLLCTPNIIYKNSSGLLSDSSILCKAIRYNGSNSPTEISVNPGSYNKELFYRTSNNSSWNSTNGTVNVGTNTWVEFMLTDWNNSSIIYSTYRVLVVEQGETGISAVYIGDYDKLIAEKFTTIKYLDYLREVISRNGNFFWLKEKNNNFNFSTNPPPTTATSNTYWENIEKFKVTATDLFFADKAYINNLVVRELVTNDGVGAKISINANNSNIFKCVGQDASDYIQIGVQEVNNKVQNSINLQKAITGFGVINTSLNPEGISILKYNTPTSPSPSLAISSIGATASDIRSSMMQLLCNSSGNGFYPAIKCDGSGIVIHQDVATLNRKRDNNVLHGVAAIGYISTNSGDLWSSWISGVYPDAYLGHDLISSSDYYISLNRFGFTHRDNFQVLALANDPSSSVRYVGVTDKTSFEFHIKTSAPVNVFFIIIDMRGYI